MLLILVIDGIAGTASSCLTDQSIPALRCSAPPKFRSVQNRIARMIVHNARCGVVSFRFDCICPARYMCGTVSELHAENAFPLYRHEGEHWVYQHQGNYFKVGSHIEDQMNEICNTGENSKGNRECREKLNSQMLCCKSPFFLKSV